MNDFERRNPELESKKDNDNDCRFMNETDENNESRIKAEKERRMKELDDFFRRKDENGNIIEDDDEYIKEKCHKLDNFFSDSKRELVQPKKVKKEIVTIKSKKSTTNLQIPLGNTPTLEETRKQNLELYYDSSFSCRLWSKKDLLVAFYNNYTLVNQDGDTVKLEYFKGRVYQSINGGGIDKGNEFSFDNFASWKIASCYHSDGEYYKPTIIEIINYHKKKKLSWL